ncbi:hypothetical protein SELMODRAFT_76503 [Selaginella moellendorffii]|uniref:CASP-like protein n=2 Tax=Selaginella moellendorffii TaxID=88036 RepID=D8QT81_SELML|nr:hypothetical protein SELMODRAFT_83683 [Selaginella moellendorffii]EFJ37566.1 hypothetical protein SELMODRAFT_76503 [Selaginella moellendorffii]
MRIKELQGMPGTVGGLALRVGQVGFAACAFSVMIRVKDFSTITAFCYLVASMVLQFVWSLTLALVDLSVLLKRTSLRNSVFLSLCVVGDWITATLTFAAACASSGIAVLIDRDLKACGNQCAKYETAAAMTFLTWLMVSPSFFFAFWLLATR